MVKKILLALACLTLITISSHASATNIYIAQNATGASNGADCADAQPVSFFNNSGNWGSGSAQIGPGTTVHLCGVFTGTAGSTMLTIQGNGASGNPVTIHFESGAQLNAPYWGGNPFNGNSGAAIVCVNHNYITVDGGTNGVVQNTANGTGLAYQQGSTGVYFQDCSSPTVENLTIQNIYVKTDVNDEVQQGIGLWVSGGNNWVITKNNVHTALYPMSLTWDANNVLTSALISYNKVNDGCHLMNGPGDSNAGMAASGITVDHNTLGPNTSIWQDPAQLCHGDGLGPTGVGNSGSSLSGYTISNNIIISDMCAQGGNCTAPIFLTGTTGTNIFNNVIELTGGNVEGLIRLAGETFPQSNVSLYNNTFIGPTGSQSAIKMTGPTTNLIAKSNIFTNLGAAWWDAANINFAQFSSGASVNNNVYYNLAARFAQGSSYINTFSNWQALTIGGVQPDANSVYGNPMLNGNFIPQAGSVAVNAGANIATLGIAALAYDLNGVPRPTGPSVAGALQPSGTGPTPPSNVTASVR